MKRLLRRFLISLSALWVTSQVFPALTITGGSRGLVVAALAFMITDFLLIPLLKILFLPLNLLTLGLFTWVTNVLALFILATVLPELRLQPYYFPGIGIGGFIVPNLNLTTFHVAVVASFIIGFIIHLLTWLSK